ncbi:MAG: hypothetical protein LM577_07745, partial [Thermoproteaceae archaeon]|nr:hypothetical protein [Thermoproteaceae archaeon]
DRRVRCPKCGLETSRDEVPAMWAMKRFDELLETAKSQSPSFSAPVAPGEFRMLINPRIPAPT